MHRRDRRLLTDSRPARPHLQTDARTFPAGYVPGPTVLSHPDVLRPVSGPFRGHVLPVLRRQVDLNTIHQELRAQREIARNYWSGSNYPDPWRRATYKPPLLAVHWDPLPSLYSPALVCARRKIRREILFAFGGRRSGSGARKKQYNHVRC